MARSPWPPRWHDGCWRDRHADRELLARHGGAKVSDEQHDRLAAVDEPSLESGTWEARRGGRATAIHVRRVRVEVVSGPDAGLVAELSQPLIRIGTHRSCDLVLSDKRVSRFHLELVMEPQGYRARDLMSTNGSFAGGMRINDAFVPPGARLRIGQSELVFIPLDGSVELALGEVDRFHGLVGGSVPMRRLYATIQALAGSDATVLITGETGTGKELVAEAIHEASARSKGPLVVLDCSAIPEHLFENELFGHEKGAFTGASTTTAGAFERAIGGTLFLDEIGELPVELQPKLLRALESRRIRRIGGDGEIACDLRVVAATNRDLAVEVNRKAFRADLYYRLAVAQLHVAPLRDRRDDIPLLIERFLELLPDGYPRAVPPEVVERFLQHGWPGNVRELRNAVERAVLAPSAAAIDDADGRPAGQLDDYVDLELPFKEARRRLDDAFDRRFLEALLERHAWNLSAVARAAQVDRMTIYKMLDRFGLKRKPG
jgi:transcriptional regulator with AAA-type ATPase domain